MGKASNGKGARRTSAARKSIQDLEAIPPKGVLPSWTNSAAVHVIFITFLGLLVYSNTFNVPFQFDDNMYINNFNKKAADYPNILDFEYYLSPGNTDAEKVWHPRFKSRFMGYLSLLINYKLGGLNVTGYHIGNLIIHTANAILVYFLVILSFGTPKLIRSTLKKDSKSIAFYSGLLFATHPIQTEAVTYLTQRFVLLSTTFYLLSIVLYLRGRLQESKNKIILKSFNFDFLSVLFYFLSLSFAVLAMKTKEIAFTLPALILLLEFMFFRAPLMKRIFLITPLFLTMLLIPLAYIENVDGSDAVMEETTRLETDMPRSDYLFTQFRVIVTYIRLLLFPANQNVDYDYTIYHSFFDVPVLLSFFLLLGVFTLGLYFLYKSSITHYALRLVSLGIYWFFLTLSIESSVIPISIIAVEYRVYLPSIGFIIAIVVSFFCLINNLERQRPQVGKFFISALILVTITFAGAAYARNTVWQSNISLWEDVVKKSPAKARGHNNLGNAYGAVGRFDEAIEHLQISLRLKPNYAVAHNNLGVVYNSEGLTDKAMEHYRTALKLKPDYADAHNNLGVAYSDKGLIDEAMDNYQLSIRLNPDSAEAHNNLGVAYRDKGMIDNAIEHLQTALRHNQDYAEGYYNLGIVYKAKGLPEKAIEHFQIALRLEPNYAEAHTNLGVVYKTQGLIDRAIEHYLRAIELKPDSAEAHNNLGNAYRIKGLTEGALKHLEIALRLKPDYTDAYTNLGIVYSSQGRFDEAITNFRNALSLNPDSTDMHFNLGLAYLENGDKKEARKEFEAALGISPTHNKARWNLNRMNGTLSD